MTKKEICIRYIAANKRLSNLEDSINNALEAVDSENRLFSLVPEDYRKLLENLVVDCLGPEVFGWIEWWLYEAKPKNIIIVNNKEVEVNSFDELWEAVLKHETD